MSPRTLAATLLMPVLLIAAACSGDSPTASRASGVRFVPASGAAGSNEIVLTAPLVGRTLVILQVEVVDVSDLHTVRFDLTYPSDVLAFNGAHDQGFLSAGQVPVAFTARAAEGAVILDAERPPGTSGVSGSGVLATIGFTVIGEGGGDLVFNRRTAKSSGGSDVAGVRWLGGRLESDL